MVNISCQFCGVQFENPFILAASPSTDELDPLRRGFERGWAGAVLKTTSVPEVPVPLKYPMITSMRDAEGQFVALGNIDLISRYKVDEVCRRVVALKREFPDKVLIVSIIGSNREQWQGLVRQVEEAGADMIESSFSCPQGTLGSKPGAMLGQDADLVHQVCVWLREASRDIPVVPKLTPMVADIVEIAQAVESTRLQGVAISNTFPSLMGIDLKTFVPFPNVAERSTYSGLSGTAIKPISLRIVAEIARQTHLGITGMGGIMDWRDAVEFMLVGARVVQLCTAVMIQGFRIIDDLVSGLSSYLESKGMKSVAELVGKSLPYLGTHDELPMQTEVKARISTRRCIKCGRCYIACLDGGHQAIELSRTSHPYVNEEKCVGCGLCFSLCPVEHCIELYMPGAP